MAAGSSHSIGNSRHRSSKVLSGRLRRSPRVSRLQPTAPPPRPKVLSRVRIGEPEPGGHQTRSGIEGGGEINGVLRHRGDANASAGPQELTVGIATAGSIKRVIRARIRSLRLSCRAIRSRSTAVYFLGVFSTRLDASHACFQDESAVGSSLAIGVTKTY